MSAGRRFRLLAAVGANLLAVSAAVRADIVAADDADNDPYGAENTFAPGQDGGIGFTPWVELELGTYYDMYLEQYPPIAGLRSWGMSGTYALGRGLETPAAQGGWTFLARHGEDVGSFSGFNLRTSTEAGSFAESEILRFGVDPSQGDATCVYYSTNAGETYEALDLGDDDLPGSILEYRVSWSTTPGVFTLQVRNTDTEASAQVTTNMPGGAPVAMFGAGIFAATLDERLAFDSFSYDNEPTRAVLTDMHLGLENGQVAVCWTTASEERTVGFRLYRLAHGAWVPVNAEFVYAQGADGLGSTYCVPDPAADAQAEQCYKLAEVEASGAVREYGPFRLALWTPRLENLRRTPEGVVLRWFSREGETYEVKKSVDLSRGFAPLVRHCPATPPVNCHTDRAAGASGYYLIRVDGGE